MNQIFKIMLIGDVSTGKTSFLTQLIYQNPLKLPKSTVELQFFSLRISSPPTVIQIWDTPGDQRHFYKAISILQNFKAVIVFVDVTNQHTLNRARLMIDQLKIYPKIVIYLVLSKVDIVQKMPYKRKVSSEEVQNLAKVNGGLMFEYSQNEKIQDILEKIVMHYSVQLNKEKEQRKEDRKIFNHQRKKLSSTEINNQSCDCLIL